MSHRMIGAFAIAALIAAGSAFAADAPPAATPAPAAATAAAPTTPAMPATPPAETPTPAATPAPTASTAPVASPAPAPAPAPATAMPAKMEKPRVSACTRAIHSAEHALKMSKAKPEAIAGAWQHIQAAKQARSMHKKDACKSEASEASKMAGMM